MVTISEKTCREDTMDEGLRTHPEDSKSKKSEMMPGVEHDVGERRDQAMSRQEVVHTKSRRGFASMDEARRSEIGRKGGEAVARERGSQFYREIGRKGGERVARERGSQFYSEIGRKGGRAVAQERGSKYYSEIGRKGGHSGRHYKRDGNDLIEKNGDKRESA